MSDPRIYLVRCRGCRRVLGFAIAGEPDPSNAPYCSTECISKAIKEGGWK